MRKDGLDAKAQEIYDELKFDFNCQLDEKDSIGKRYRRQDAIGTPYCITVDHETLTDNCVTIRHRDTMQQERVNIDQLESLIEDKVSNHLVAQKNAITMKRKSLLLLAATALVAMVFTACSETDNSGKRIS